MVPVSLQANRLPVSFPVGRPRQRHAAGLSAGRGVCEQHNAVAQVDQFQRFHTEIVNKDLDSTPNHGLGRSRGEVRCPRAAARLEPTGRPGEEGVVLKADQRVPAAVLRSRRLNASTTRMLTREGRWRRRERGGPPLPPTTTARLHPLPPPRSPATSPAQYPSRRHRPQSHRPSGGRMRNSQRNGRPHGGASNHDQIPDGHPALPLRARRS